MKNLLLILLVLLPATLSAQELDRPLQAVDSFAPKEALETVPDIQVKLRAAVTDAGRSNYERSRAVTYLMYWPNENRAFIQSIAHSTPAVTKAVLLGLAKNFPTTLTAAETDLFFEAVVADDWSVGVVALMATQLLPDALAREILEFAQAGDEKVARRAQQILTQRFGTIE